LPGSASELVHCTGVSYWKGGLKALSFTGARAS
jgi:putative copper export protein